MGKELHAMVHDRTGIRRFGSGKYHAGRENLISKIQDSGFFFEIFVFSADNLF
jgi:uncharacterized membrane protein